MLAGHAAYDSTGGPLTLETFQAAIKAIEQQREPHPCSLGQHLVSAGGMRALRAGGHARCADCGSIL